MSPFKLPKIWPFKVEVVRKRELIVIQRNEFEVCHPATREVPEWLGLKKKTLLIHLRENGDWNIRKV